MNLPQDIINILAGAWWQPTWGAEYGASTTVVDNSTNARTDAGDLPSDRAPMHQELTLTLPWLSETERSQLMQRQRQLVAHPSHHLFCEQDADGQGDVQAGHGGFLCG